MNVYLHVATDKLYVIRIRGWKNDAKSFELGYIKRFTEFLLKQKSYWFLNNHLMISKICVLIISYFQTLEFRIINILT